jgi:hypothetical protein
VERRPDPRHVFDRDPLLIPQLFVDQVPPWYKRARWWFAIAASVSAISVVGVLVAQEGPRGAMGALGRAGAGVMHVYTRLVAGGTPSATPHH